MVASIPNDIFQFSVISALVAGLAESGPQCAHLTNHGTHGIGTFSDMNGEMILIDRVAWHMTADGKVRKAALDAMLPFVQVCIYQPEFRVRAPKRLTKQGIWGLIESQGGRAGGRNSYMPFRLQGSFSSMDIRVVRGRQDKDAGLGEAADNALHKTLKDVKGTMFGFSGPVWSAGISVEGLHCHFLSDEKDGERTGGHVKEFVAEDGVVLDWAVCGRFHLGLPRGDDWESLDLAADEKVIKKAEE